MAPTKSLAAFTAVALATVCLPSPASAQSFIADLVAAPFYIAGAALGTAAAIVTPPYYGGYYGYGPYGYPAYGYPAYGYPPYGYRARYAGPEYTYGPVTYYFGPSCGYDPWGRWACAVR
jgi:hypothetical protein